jgi:hypothetical protein
MTTWAKKLLLPFTEVVVRTFSLGIPLWVLVARLSKQEIHFLPLKVLTSKLVGATSSLVEVLSLRLAVATLGLTARLLMLVAD